jgi:hypothetical protein
MKCPRERCLLEEHTGHHWYGSPQRSPGFVDDAVAVRELYRAMAGACRDIAAERRAEDQHERRVERVR